MDRTTDDLIHLIQNIPDHLETTITITNPEQPWPRIHIHPSGTFTFEAEPNTIIATTERLPAEQYVAAVEAVRNSNTDHTITQPHDYRHQYGHHAAWIMGIAAGLDMAVKITNTRPGHPDFNLEITKDTITGRGISDPNVTSTFRSVDEALWCLDPYQQGHGPSLDALTRKYAGALVGITAGLPGDKESDPTKRPPTVVANLQRVMFMEGGLGVTWTAPTSPETLQAVVSAALDGDTTRLPDEETCEGAFLSAMELVAMMAALPTISATFRVPDGRTFTFLGGHVLSDGSSFPMPLGVLVEALRESASRF